MTDHSNHMTTANDNPPVHLTQGDTLTITTTFTERYDPMITDKGQEHFDLQARLITDEELAAMRKWRERGGGTMGPFAFGAVIDAILARNPEPWSPSEDDITAYSEARGWDPPEPSVARYQLIEARKRGWDAIPRRLTDG